MPGERGGPANQSGVSYQNLYTTHQIAVMLGTDASLPAHRRIISVRGEAPALVDDVLITFADGSRTFVQAKEDVDLSSGDWNRVLRTFTTQFESDFDRERDILLLCVGTDRENFVQLHAMFERAGTSVSFDEWQERLNQEQRNLWSQKLADLCPGGEDLWPFVRRVRVEVHLRPTLEADALRLLPQSYNNNGPISRASLFSHIKSYVPDDARVRRQLTAQDWANRLRDEHSIRLDAPIPLAQMRAAVERCSAVLRGQRGTFGNRGAAEQRHIKRAITGEILEWILATDQKESIGVLLDGAGKGKTVVLRDLLWELEARGVTTLAIKADGQLDDLSRGKAIHECQGVSLPAPVEEIAAVLGRASATEGKPMVVLLDQVDALSLSMTRDGRAIEAISTLVHSLRFSPNVRVLLACRTFDLNTTPKLRALEINKRFSLPDLTSDEINATLRDAGVESHLLSPTAHKLFKTPLHLDIFLRAIEERDGEERLAIPISGDLRMGSLHGLYRLLWERFITSSATPATPAERLDVVRLLKDSMHRKQRTTAPDSLFMQQATERLLPARDYLASQGLLQRQGDSWSFLHQTFYDYAFAWFFVEEDEGSLAQTIWDSPQGLDERPLLHHVLGFLRATDEVAYGRELKKLGIESFFGTSELAKHLQILLREWFGALKEPSDLEWRHAQNLLQNDEHKLGFLQKINGSGDWFARLLPAHIPRWLQQLDERPGDQFLENTFWFLASVSDDAIVQAQVVPLLRPYLHRSEQWNRRIQGWLSQLRQWHTKEAVALYEELLLTFWNDQDGMFRYYFCEVAKAFPKESCQILRRVLALNLEKMRATLPERQESFYGDIFTVFQEQATGGLTLHREVLDILSEEAPADFLEAAWEFTLAVLPMGMHRLADENGLRFPNDACHDAWEIRTSSGVIHRSHFGFDLAKSLGQAIQKLAKEQPTQFENWLNRMVDVPLETAQMLVLDALCAEPKKYAARALEFLRGDERRLQLGAEQFETRRLIREVAPFWSKSQCLQLEDAILNHWELPYYLKRDLRDIKKLKWRGYEQWRLLHALSVERLSSEGQKRLNEWDRKFPNYALPDVPTRSWGGFISSPIDGEQATLMSDKDWLKAMRHYQRGVEHRNSRSMRGGAEQLCHVLEAQVVAQPERFARLFLERVPLEVDAFYVKGAINGLAKSAAPGELLFSVVRRFLAHCGPDVYQDLPITIARALSERAGSDLPDDLLEMLQNWVRSAAPESDNESFYLDQQNQSASTNYDTSHGGALMDYLNSTRGQALSVVFKTLHARGDSEALWHWVEAMASESSAALRVGAVWELLSIAQNDPARAWSAFSSLIEGHAAVLRSHFAFQFLYHSVYQFPEEARPIVQLLLNDPFDNIREEGAKIACVLALRSGAIDLQLLDELQSGPEEWRCGLAEVCANSITRDLAPDTAIACEQYLASLLEDENKEVRRKAARFASDLHAEHLKNLTALLEKFVVSAAYPESAHWYHEFLFNYGDLKPSWTITQIQTILHRSDHPSHGLRGLDGDELTRSVLRLYTLPEADDLLRSQAIKLFGELLELAPHYAQKMLHEWDEGRYS